MSLRIGGSGEDGRRRRKRLVIVSAVIAALILLWVAVVLRLGIGGGGSGGPQEQGQGGGPSKNAAQGGSRTQEKTAKQQASKEGRSAPEDSSTVLRSEKPGQTDHVTPKDPEKFRLAEQKRDKLASGEPPVPVGGATNEPAGYDPLGIKDQKVPLTPTDRDRVRGAASHFIASAYGYSGPEGTSGKYLSGVNEAVLSPEFYSSKGAKEIRKYSEQVKESGTKSAAKMTRWDVSEASENEVKGLVYFQTADGYDRYGELTGKKKTYRQALTLVRFRAAFKVKAAGPIQEVRIK